MKKGYGCWVLVTILLASKWLQFFFMLCFELIFGVIDTNRAAADNLCATHFERFKIRAVCQIDDLFKISCVRARKFFPKSYFSLNLILLLILIIFASIPVPRERF